MKLYKIQPNKVREMIAASQETILLDTKELKILITFHDHTNKKVYQLEMEATDVVALMKKTLKLMGPLLK